MTVAAVVGTPNTEVDAIGRKAARGLKWTLGGTAISKLGGLFLGLVMARLLAPAEFGLFAVALAATQFVMMIKDLGVIAATSHWRGSLDELAPTATTIAFTFSAAVYVIFWFGAPAFAELAGNPEAASVVRVLTSVILIEAVIAVRSGALMREFRQDRIIKANLCGLTVQGIVAISLAASGTGAMSLAVGQVAGAAVIGVILYISAGIPFRFGFDPPVARWLLRFGLPLAGGLAVEAILLNADFIIIGRLLDVRHLGYYLLAFNISSWALSTITMSVRYVSVAGFSRLSEMDADTLSTGVQRSFTMLYKVVVPVGVLTAALATQIVVVMYGTEWSPAASALRYLAVLTIVRVLISLALDILMGTGATRSMLWINTLWAIALIPALIVGVELGGIRGAGIAHAVVGVAVALPLTVLALQRLGIHLAPIVPTLLRPTIGGIAAAAAALALDELVDTAAILEMLVAGAGGLITYVAIAVPLDDLRDWSRVARERFRGRRAASPAGT